MGGPHEMAEPVPKKRSIEDDDEQGRKAKRKKKTANDRMDIDKMLLAGEIPNLFFMMTQELLKETRMKKQREEKLRDTVEKLKDALLNLSPGKERKITAQKWTKDFQVPVVQEPETTKGCFQFRAPTRVFLGGSVPLNTCVSQVADLVMEMPKDCFQAKDALNHRYIRKRALYLTAVAMKLVKSGVLKQDNIQFQFQSGNRYKPILVLTVPVSGKEKPLTVHLHAIPEEGVFKASRFHITKNNVRPRWFSSQDQEDGDTGNEEVGRLPSTPVYNTSVLQDVCYNANAEFLSEQLQGTPDVQDAIALLKVWLHQRELDVGYGSFGGHVMSMYVCHLLKEGQLLRSMNCCQLMRHTLFCLSKSKWLENPVSLCPQQGEGNRPKMEQFQQDFDVVFVDVTGFVNLCMGMSKAVYKRVCHEAGLTMDGAEVNFDACSFMLKYDTTFRLTLTPDVLQTVVQKFQLQERVLDHGGDLVATVMPSLVEVLERGLGDRVILVQPLLQPSHKWSVTEAPPPQVSDCTLTFGLLLDKNNSLRMADIGPPANQPQARDFRQFWGEKSEMRRFPGSGIFEGVKWIFRSGLSHRRSVCNKIIAHVLNRHAGISPDKIHPAGSQVESVLHVPRRLIVETSGEGEGNKEKKKKDNNSGAVYGTGEERIFHIHQVLEELGKVLRNLSSLALRINAVTGIDPVFRFSEVFPAHPAVSRLTSESLLKGDKSPLPIYTPAMTVICTVEGSGHWPEDINRIRDLKTIFLIDLGDKLSDLGLKVNVQETYLDVLKDGYVFRLKLGVSREVGVLRMVRSAEGMRRMEDTPEAKAVEAEITTLPELTTLLQGVQQEHCSFSCTVRLIKRWLSAQLLLGHLSEVMVDKMVVQLFQHPLPFTAPVSPFVGLCRFLDLISRGEYKVEKFCDSETCPPPPQVIVNWLKSVATQSLRVLQTQPESEWKVIFKPPLNVFDMVFHLSHKHLTRRHQAVGELDIALRDWPQNRQQLSKLPVTDFNPAEILLENIRAVFGDFALFFHDHYGGDVIAVLLKPGINDAKKVELGNLFSQKATVVDGDPVLTFDMDAMVEAVCSMGGDLVIKVNKKS